MSDPFAALHQTLFSSPLCEDVTLRGVPARAFVDRNIEMIGEYGQVAGRQTLVDLPVEHAPEQGDTLIISGIAYILDTPAGDDGHVSRWIVRLDQ